MIVIIVIIVNRQYKDACEKIEKEQFDHAELILTSTRDELADLIPRRALLRLPSNSS